MWAVASTLQSTTEELVMTKSIHSSKNSTCAYYEMEPRCNNFCWSRVEQSSTVTHFGLGNFPLVKPSCYILRDLSRADTIPLGKLAVAGAELLNLHWGHISLDQGCKFLLLQCLCGIPWLPAARIPSHWNYNAYTDSPASVSASHVLGLQTCTNTHSLRS
ncbi:hypothetical protein LEMLEM_LOCUS24907 [Lemmus lemmus]